MIKMVSVWGAALILLVCSGVCFGQRKLSRTQTITTEIKTGVNFDCPEEFGYYPHPTDCTQYYVCVFGGALLESCTGGLMYSHELQTCDWPRNVGCDALGEVTHTATASPSTSIKSEPRTRYTPPPPPPQPAAVVTSRGQPRQLHHSQQEIIKQQRQLYEDAEEALPPAEEIESDRQQRVYRGQPSTVGQVQRDRDGLRHSNAIPNYGGRSEKIGVISFGTQQQPQHLQQYRKVTDNIDNFINDLTFRRSERQKRQVQRSRHPGFDTNSWHGNPPGHKITFPNNSKTIINLQPPPLQKFPNHNPNFVTITHTQAHFRPFIPPEFKKKPPNPGHDKNQNFQYFNLHNAKSNYFNVAAQPRPTPPYKWSENINYSRYGNEKEMLKFEPRDHIKPNISSPNFSLIHKEPKNHKPRPILDYQINRQNPFYFENTSYTTENPDYRPDFLSPPTTFSKPTKHFEQYLRETSFTTEKVSINNTKVSNTTLKPVKIKTTTLSDEYYYDDDDDEEYLPESRYSSQLKPYTKKHNDSVPMIKRPAFVDEEEYYYDYEEYPETVVTVKTTAKDNHIGNIKYSSRYNEKKQSPGRLISETTTYKTTTITTPKPTYSVRQKTTARSTTRSTTRSHIQRLTTNNQFNDPNSRHDKQNTSRVEVTSVSPSQQSSVATGTARALYNGSQHYDPAHYDPYYSLYEDDVELYRDVDYTQHYNSNSGQSQPTYRGTPAPVTQAPTPTESKRGNVAYIQNSYTTQDVYQPVADYNEDNSYNSHVEEQTNYRQSNRQPSRGDRNELNYVEEIATTKRTTTTSTTTTTTTTTPRPIPTQKSTIASRSPVTSKANQTRAQSLPNTLPENPGHNPLLSSTASKQTNQNSSTTSKTTNPYENRQDAPPTVPITYRPKYNPDTATDYSLHAPVRSAVVNQPAPFSLPLPTKSQSYHFITKASKSTSPVSSSVRPSTQLPKRRVHYVRSTEKVWTEQASATTTTTTPRSIIPTTYAPPKFFLKSILPKSITTTTLDSPLKTVNIPENTISLNKPNNQTNITKSNIKTIRKYINPIIINNIFASSTELYPISEDSSFESELTDRGKIKFPNSYKIITEKPASTTHTIATNPPTTSITTTTTTTTPAPPKTTSTPTTTTITTTTTAATTTSSSTTTVSTTTTYTAPSSIHSSTLAQSKAPSTEKFRHYVEPNQSYTPNVKRFRNTVEVPPPHQLLVDPDDIAKPEPDQPPTYKPKPPKLSNDNLTKTAADSARNTSLPARVSRVNAAIKSIIGFGGTRRQNPKCNENQTTNVKCNEIKQRTSNRGRGSAHYSSSNAGSSSNSNAGDTVTVNRGTPPTRSRPTLKPSTSIVSKATEYIDIYRFPPRRPEAIYPTPQPDKTAAKCRKDVCLLPDCSCGGKEIPGDLPVEEVPQMVLLTFDDAVNDLNKLYYTELFENGRVNPNGCPIAATFYVSHEWTDYSQVQNLYADGHEMASHTVSHSFGEQFSQKKWTREIAGQREILSAYGGVKLEDVRGMRAPFLSVGGNKMFKMLYDSNFTYDSSMPIYENKPPSWPYTLDYKLFHDCMIPPCPTRSYPGVWEVPMVMWQDLNGGRCSMGDACSNPPDSDGVFKMLMKNFDRHYTSNRSPFGLFYHAAWFTQPHHKEGFIRFLDNINKMNDVFLVTNWQAIQWVRDPTPMSRIANFQPFQCNYGDRPKRCNNPKVCNLWHKSGVRYMRTCQPCPDIYPWTGNTGIRSSRIDNDIED